MVEQGSVSLASPQPEQNSLTAIPHHFALCKNIAAIELSLRQLLDRGTRLRKALGDCPLYWCSPSKFR